MRFILSSLLALFSFGVAAETNGPELVTRENLNTGVVEVLNTTDGSWQLVAEGPGGTRPTVRGPGDTRPSKPIFGTDRVAWVNREPGQVTLGGGRGRPMLGGGGVIPVEMTTRVPTVWAPRDWRVDWRVEDPGQVTGPSVKWGKYDDGRGIRPYAFEVVGEQVYYYWY